jgi:hypothetical protein
MANSKISALTAATTPVAGTEVLPIVQSSATVKLAISDLTPGLSTITAAKGGTGQTTYAVGDLLYASASTTLSKLADVATGNALISGGVTTAPSWGKIGLTTHVSGTLPAANGGTNITSFTSGGVTYASSTSALATGSTLVTDGSYLIVGGATVRDSTKLTVETSSNGMSIYVVPNTNAVDFAIFRANAGTLCGAISRVGTTGAVVYTATSDYRLKENVAPMTGALSKVAALKPVTFTWKDGGYVADGFIAHEFAEVCPNGVIGEKDGVDVDGNPKYQAMDSSAAISILVAAIQEQQALIIQLQADVAELKNKP